MLNRIRLLRKAAIIGMLLLLAVAVTIAQEDPGSPYPKVTIASPTAVSLGKYTDIPVNYHTGIPQINMPIYTIKEGPLSLPVSLNYHAGGIKVMEPASWVGAGWSLQAGGMITRVVRGAPDEAGTTGMGVYGHFSHYGFSNYLTINSGSTAPYDQAFANAQYDGEPDLFSFSFNGYSGKFYFDDDRKPVLVNGEDLKIDYYFPRDTASSFTAQSSNIQGFIITVPSGDKYHFGITPGGNTSGVSAVETSFLYSGDPNMTDRLFASWFLNKIVSADGMFSINLTYAAENYSYFTLSMFPVNGNFSSNWTNPSQNEYKLVKNYVQGVRLNQVSFSNGIVSFLPGSNRTDLSNSYFAGATYDDNANTEAKVLDAIAVTNNQGFCKKFRFFYSYFTAPDENLPGYLSNYSIQSDRYRLRLDSLQELTCNNTLSLPPHRFIYNSSTLSRRLSFGQDHWGYANGVVGNNTLVPTYTINTYKFVPGADREPAWPAMQQGALAKIIYPTGGYTAYQFEPNRTWISTTRYNETFRYSYSVGYDGSNTASFTNLSFSNNYYRVVKSNSACPPNTPGCTAGASLVNGSNSVALGGIAGNSRDTSIILIPAGTYTLNMWRDAAQTGSGAQYTFTEIIPQAVNENAMVGGLRIRQIIQKDSALARDSILTNYEYNVNNRSTGVLYSRPAYVQVVRNNVVKMFGLSPAGSGAATHPNTNGCMGPETGNNTQLYFKSPCPIFPMASTQGNHIGYNEVKVFQPGNGYSIYRYYGSGQWDTVDDDIAYRNINPTICNPSTPNSPAAPLPYEYRRGQLKYEGHFTEAGQLLKESYYTMQFDSTQSTPAYMVNYVLGALLGNTYELKGYRKKQTQVITNTLIPATGASSQVIQTVYNESPWHNQPTRLVTIQAAGDTQTIRHQYSRDFRISYCDTISTGLTAYNTACTSCDATMYTATAGCTTVSCRYGAWVNNIICRANARKAYITRRRNNFTNSSNAFAACLLNAKNAADVALKPILELQQQSILLPIETARWKNTWLVGASFYGYDYMAYPVGKVYLAKGRKVNLAAPAGSFTQAVTAAGNTSLAMDSRYADESSFKYYGGNPVQLTAKDGISNTFVWDYQNTLPVASITNATTDRVAYTSFETNGLGGWNLNSGAVLLSNGGVTGIRAVAGGVNKTVPAGNYVVSVWSTGNTWINGQLQTQPPVKSIGAWKLIELALTNVTTINVSGDTIDEVRLFPQGALMTTYTYAPLIGITSQCDATGRMSYYEYDSLARLIRIRDDNGNILKQVDYQYQAPVHGNAVWQATGITRCKPCAQNAAYTSSVLQNQEKDINPNSTTYNQLRWADAGTSSTCTPTPDWQNTTTALRCRQAGGQNTGEQEQEQRDNNPCSISYNVPRWVIAGTNLTACPLPVVTCDASNCSGNDKKCVFGVCETGRVVAISSVWKKVVYNGAQVFKWECVHKYCFSDGTGSTYTWITYNDTPCAIGNCNPE
ncbi:hypothetical protein [Paraflavitalea soli]|nr:hypothetical protein [Paraflavitalea soli]